MESKSRRCSLPESQIDAVNDAIQMLDDFIERRAHLLGYSLNDIDDLDVPNSEKQKIKYTLKNNSSNVHSEYLGHGIYRAFCS